MNFSLLFSFLLTIPAYSAAEADCFNDDFVVAGAMNQNCIDDPSKCFVKAAWTSAAGLQVFAATSKWDSKQLARDKGSANAAKLTLKNALTEKELFAKETRFNENMKRLGYKATDIFKGPSQIELMRYLQYKKIISNYNKKAFEPKVVKKDVSIADAHHNKIVQANSNLPRAKTLETEAVEKAQKAVSAYEAKFSEGLDSRIRAGSRMRTGMRAGTATIAGVAVVEGANIAKPYIAQKICTQYKYKDAADKTEAALWLNYYMDLKNNGQCGVEINDDKLWTLMLMDPEKRHAIFRKSAHLCEVFSTSLKKNEALLEQMTPKYTLSPNNCLEGEYIFPVEVNGHRYTQRYEVEPKRVVMTSSMVSNDLPQDDKYLKFTTILNPGYYTNVITDNPTIAAIPSFNNNFKEANDYVNWYKNNPDCEPLDAKKSKNPRMDAMNTANTSKHLCGIAENIMATKMGMTELIEYCDQHIANKKVNSGTSGGKSQNPSSGHAR